MKSRVVITIAVFIATMMVATLSFADVIWIPMATKVEKFKEECKLGGLNLYGGDESDGFVEDNGTKIKVVTYSWMEDEQLDLIMRSAVTA